MSQSGDNVTIALEDLVSKMWDTTESKPTIFQVDDYMRKVNEKDYEPGIVSIGPIHHGKDHVKSMEQHKVRLLKQLLQKRPDLSIYKFVEKLREIEAEALQCYSKSSNLDRDKFVGILLLDGCFIIQLIRKYFLEESRDEDPIFESETLTRISHDLMLFENQIPFFVLSSLFDMIKTDDPDDNLCDLILFLVGDMLRCLHASINNLSPEKPPGHLLGLVYGCLSTKLPSKPNERKKKRKKKKNNSSNNNSTLHHINSASELKEVGGIQLTRSEDNSITFAGRVLKLPPLQVSAKTESLLRNVMAYEQLQLDDDHPRHVTDYVFFLHCLTRSIHDIEILRCTGIISNCLGGDEKILEMFDRLGTNFMRSSDFCHADVFESLNRHCRHRRNKYMAKLLRTHFNGPWSVIKFLAATLLLLLTFAQTVFSVLSFIFRRN